MANAQSTDLSEPRRRPHRTRATWVVTGILTLIPAAAPAHAADRVVDLDCSTAGASVTYADPESPSVTVKGRLTGCTSPSGRLPDVTSAGFSGFGRDEYDACGDMHSVKGAGTITWQGGSQSYISFDLVHYPDGDRRWWATVYGGPADGDEFIIWSSGNQTPLDQKCTRFGFVGDAQVRT